MAIKLSDKELELFNKAKEFSLKYIAPYADQWENGEKKPGEAMDMFVENGYCALGVAKELGGKGFNFLECALIYEGLAHGDGALSSSMIQLHNNIVYTLAKFYNTNRVVRELLPSMVSGKKMLAFAITEEHSGSDPSSMKSYAVLKNDGYHIYGEKAWIFNALEADHFVVIVKDGSPDTRDMLMLLVDRNTPGFSISNNIQRLGNNCISCCNLEFDNCIVPEERLLTNNGFREALSFIDLPRIFVPAIAIGMSQRVINMTVDYLGERTAFNKPIISNQGVQWTLAELLTQVEAGRWLVYRTASKMDNGKSIEIQSAMNKLFSTDVAMNTTTKCLQLFGAKGYDKQSVLSRYMSVAKLLQIVDGTSEIQKLIIGRSLERKTKN